jgi:hypothetical protein
MGISKQMSESTSASDMCSASVYGPTGRQLGTTGTGLVHGRTFLDGVHSDEKRNADALPERKE